MLNEFKRRGRLKAVTGLFFISRLGSLAAEADHVFEGLLGAATSPRDLIAGLTVGLVALPLAMAFGIASGVTPQAGIYTAMSAVSWFRRSEAREIQIGGPTGAFVVIVAGIIAKHGLSGLLMVTMMAGVILLFLGFTGLGTAVKFIPRPIIIGFTNGIALLIASTQIKDFLGSR